MYHFSWRNKVRKDWLRCIERNLLVWYWHVTINLNVVFERADEAVYCRMKTPDYFFCRSTLVELCSQTLNLVAAFWSTSSFQDYFLIMIYLKVLSVFLWLLSCVSAEKSFLQRGTQWSNEAPKWLDQSLYKEKIPGRAMLPSLVWLKQLSD